MGVAAVTRVDHTHPRGGVTGDEVGRATVAVPDHEHVDMHRLEVSERIEQGFTLGRCRGADVEIQDIGRQPFRGELEGRPCPGAVLEEEVCDSLATQGRDFLD